MRAEFEEKEYEGPLNIQLLNGQPNLWPPGHVFEKHLGFDVALLATLPQFWSTVGMPVPPRGVVPEELRWGRVWRKLGWRRRLPAFRVNLFLQAKRPEFLQRRSVALAGQGLSSPFWRFDLTPHQQSALVWVERRLRHRAMVSYAAPAFHLASDLFAHIEAGSLVDNSTFVSPSVLTKHERWVYDRPGSWGIGCSEPELFEGVPIANRLAMAMEAEEAVDVSLGDAGQIASETLAADNLRILSDGLRESISEANVDGGGRADEFLRRADRLRTADQLPPEVSHFLTVDAFANTFGLSWLTVA